MTDRPPRQESPIHSLEDVEQPSMKITKENLDEVLRVLRIVLDEEASTDDCTR